MNQRAARIINLLVLLCTLPPISLVERLRSSKSYAQGWDNVYFFPEAFIGWGPPVSPVKDSINQ